MKITPFHRLPRRWTGLLVRSTFVVICASILAGILALAYTAHTTNARAQDTSNQRLNELLDTVSSTLAVACFAKDHTLAAELAQGLLSNSDVLAVRISTDNELLADKHRGPTTLQASAKPITRAIPSPFDPAQILGQVVLTPDPKAIDRRIRDEVWIAVTQLGWQLGMGTLVMLVIMLLFVVRPIKAISDRLHVMDPTCGDRLPIPKGHNGTEIGHLVVDINALSDRLVATLSAEQKLRLQGEIDERKYHTIFDNAESGLFLIDSRGILTSWNRAFERLFAVDPEAAKTSLKPTDMCTLPWLHPSQVSDLLQSALHQKGAVTRDLQVLMPDGRERWINVVLSPVADNLLQGVLHDVSHLKESEASARQQAVTDRLTGLLNRTGLEERLRAHVQKCVLSPSEGFSLLLINIDEFRRVNEGMGISAGDNILVTTTARLSACVKSEDILARFGADNFAILLNNISHQDMVDGIANRVMRSMRQTYYVDGSPVSLQASIGITLFPGDGFDVPTLLRQAELAVESAKSLGGNTHVFFNPVLSEAAEKRRHLENDLRQAIRNQEFVLFYQPIIDLHSLRLSGAEALIRWRHPARGLVPPDSFIPLCERTGLIAEIGLFALDTACQQLQTWQKQGLDYTLSINVSARQIPDGLTATHLQNAITQYGILPEKLALEITEGVMMHDVDKSLQWLNAVRELGFRVYLDDFGTGYSSLSYLKRFPVNTLKIDRSFVQDMQEHGNERTLVGAIIAMGKSLGLDIVAEGVEQRSHMEALKQMGCHYAQGYFFSRPVPAAEFAAAAQRISELLEPANI